MGANSKFHKVIGAAEVVVGAILDWYGYTPLGNSLILAGLATFQGMPGTSQPTPAAFKTVINSAIAPQQIVYGKVKTAGPLLIADTGNQGPANFKYIAVAHSLSLKTGGTSALRCEGLYNTFTTEDGYWIDNNNIPAVCVNPSTGVITGSGSVGNLINYDGILSLFTHYGDQTTVDSNLNAGLSYWASTAIGYGVCYTVACIHADPTSKLVQAAFPNGLPTSISIALKGQRVYDPRLDSTAGGSGSQRKATPSTWTYSANPALCLRDYLVRPISEGGAGVDPTRIPDDYLTAAANACDATITVPNNLGGTTTQPAYQCGVGLSTADSIPANIQKLLDAMAGWIVETSGELRIFAGSYTAPVTTINESWLCGYPSFQTTAEQSARWNTVSTTFDDPDSNYTTIQTPAYAAPGAVAADGGIAITRTLNTPAAVNQYGAQFLTMISANQSREQALLQLPCNLKAMDVDCGEVVAITLAEYGLSAATYRITNWQRKTDSSILLSLQKANSGTFTPGTFVQTIGLGVPALTQDTPATVTTPTATGGVGQIVLTWDKQPTQAIVGYEVWRSTASGGTYSLIATPTDASYIDPQPTTSTWFYKIRSYNYRGITSAAFSSIVSATATVPVAPTGQNLVLNGNFESATTMTGLGAPPGWTNGAGPPGNPVGTPSAIVYETGAPFDGAQTLHFTATATKQGVGQMVKFNPTVGDTYYVSAAMKTGGGSQVGQFGIFFYDKTGTLLGSISVSTSAGQTSYATQTAKSAVPANTATAYIIAQNTNAGAADIYVDDCVVIRMASNASGTDIGPLGSMTPTSCPSALGYSGYGSTSYPAWIASHFYSFGSIIKDSNGNLQVCSQAGTTGGAHPAWSAVDGGVTIDNGAVWYCYDNSTPLGATICWFWLAFNISLMDGTTITVPNTIIIQSGLSDGTTYYFYPMFNTKTGHMTFAGKPSNPGYNASPVAGSDAFGSNGIGYTTPDPTAVAQQLMQNCIPMSSTGMPGITPAAGSSGTGAAGGGASNNGCPHPKQLIDTEMGRVEAGDFLKPRRPLYVQGPDGFVEVLEVDSEPCNDWRQVTVETMDEKRITTLVSATHCSVHVTGELIRASDLKIGTILRAAKGKCVRVSELKDFKDESMAVKLHLGNPHLFLLDADGAQEHNPNQKP